jgi:hypothetical protein
VRLIVMCSVMVSFMGFYSHRSILQILSQSLPASSGLYPTLQSFGNSYKSCLMNINMMDYNLKGMRIVVKENSVRWRLGI